MKNGAVFAAVLSAALYAVSIPIAKIFLADIGPLMMSAFLYLGAGFFMAVSGGVLRALKVNLPTGGLPLSRSDMPYGIGMIVLNIAALAAVMTGLSLTSAATASLLSNFEIAATAVIALMIFHERVPGRLWIAIVLVTVSSIVLSVENTGAVTLSPGAFLILAGCLFWGFENNCTRKLADKSPLTIVVLKGIFSGAGALLLAVIAGETLPPVLPAAGVMLLGFVSYGLSIFFYVYAQRFIGAARTSTYYAVAPFIGAAFSLVMFQEMPTVQFAAALVIMALGVYFASTRRSYKS